MSHNVLADECVDCRIVRKLQTHGFTIISVAEEAPSIPDEEVLDLAKKSRAILLTEDKDFGKWVFAHKHKDVGVILLRYNPADVEKIVRSLLSVLKKYKDSLSRKFVVIGVNKIRIRDL